MNRISSRQLYFFLACVAPVGKLVVLPARLASCSGNDLLLPAAFHIALQTAVIFCVLLIAKRGKDLFGLLSGTFGRAAASVLVPLFSAFLLYAGILPVLEQQIFVQGVFYDTLPSLTAFTPFFLFSAYLCSKPLAGCGRTWDILGPIAAAGLAGIFVLSVANADFGAMLPAGASGAKGILGGTAYTFGWFYDSAVLLMLLGKFDYQKGMAWKGALFYLLGGAAVLFFLAVFYGIFEETAINQLFAFTKTSKYFSGITVLGRVDYLFIFALSLVMAFYVALPLQAGIDGVLQTFGRRKYLPTLLAAGVNALFFVFTVLFDFRFVRVMDFITKTAFWVFPLFTVLIPLLCLPLGRNRRERA